MKVLKFGGKSLATALDKVIAIVQNLKDQEPLTLVVSAIGDTTDVLESILSTAKDQGDYVTEFADFKDRPYHHTLDLSKDFDQLFRIYEGVYLLGDYNLKIKDQVLAFGELISSKIVTQKLIENGIYAKAVDSRQFFVTDQHFGNARIKEQLSKKNTQTYFAELPPDLIPVVTGFIAQSDQGETTTLGRNGSNYSASLLANYLEASELQNYTHVDGLFTANPEWVKDAQKIEELDFEDANELAVFGTSILHAKTILPLVENKVPLRILNTLNPEGKGTLISSKGTAPGIKAISLLSDVALIQLEGRGLLSRVGVDARVFGAIAQENISVGVISQGSSERGVGFIVKEKDAVLAVEALQKEFENDIYRQDVSSIFIRSNLAVISIVGMDLGNFDKAYAALVKNKIVPILFNNAVTGRNVSIVVKKSDSKKAMNVIHGHIFGISKKVNVAIFGHGTVGGTLIDQILESKKEIEKRKNIQLNIFAIGNSKRVLLNSNGIADCWKEKINSIGVPYDVYSVIEYAKFNNLENLIAVDNTASIDFVRNYIPLVENGFDLVSSNKIGNTIAYDFYKELRETLKRNHKEYLYETNVGAGLPLIDNLKLLHLSGECVTGIRGIFSGSLSYIFNKFSVSDQSFSQILKQAIAQGFTEPDPREDLCGNDVGRKLLILARELDLQNEFDDIQIENLIPEALQKIDIKDFLNDLEALDSHFNQVKQNLKPNHVLRYIGELSGDLSGEKGILETRLIQVPVNSALGQLTGSDSLFEIYTESYGKNPIIIQGAGAGASVTARGVFGDILRLINKQG